ncbi:RlpA-like double-psi beta-barrel-protein domain-containing protein-containing protein, partial [Radiomyces spectabilis]|uniref:RlpA-like double-psi beta-barrel-protein domain-containing protein-containing protein n=1 Tax=Radiomyces spectabilis TaxID=64574 RepID=UPI00221FCDE4
RLTRKGEATFYTTGLGSCGKTSRNNEMVAALSGLLMLSGNYCGRKIRASSQHGSVMLKVVDTCPACAPGDIDMSPAAFRKLAKLDEGRIPISW